MSVAGNEDSSSSCLGKLFESHIHLEQVPGSLLGGREGERERERGREGGREGGRESMCVYVCVTLGTWSISPMR